jgi:hypothetical protein
MPTLGEMPYFNGEMDSDALDKWIRTLMVQIVYYKTSKALVTEEEKVVFAMAHLGGIAADWWQSTACRTVTTLQEFVDAMNRRFKSVLDEDVAADRLRGLKQGTNSAHVYAGQVQQLLTRLPELDRASRVRAFVWGLEPVLQQKVREIRPATFELAYEHAIRIEGSFVNTPNKFNALTKLNQVDADEADDEDKPVTLAAMKRYVDVKSKANGGGAGGLDRDPDWKKKLNCFNCNKMGHFKSECKSTRDYSRMVCHNCKKRGHPFFKCTEPKSSTTSATPPSQGK